MLECDVFVIGCGPAGASLALYLAQKNIKVIVAEKKNNLETRIRCAGFVPANIAGLFDFKIKGINNRTEFLETYAAKNPSEKFQMISKTIAPGFILDRDIFVNSIASKFMALGGTLLKGTKVISIQQGPDGFTLNLSDAASKNHLTVRAKIIAGADGPLSLAGRLMGSTNKSFMPAIQQNPAILLKRTDCNKVFFAPYISCGYGWLFPKTGSINIGVGAFLERKTIWTRNRAEKKLLDSERYTCKADSRNSVGRDSECAISSIKPGFENDYCNSGKDRDSCNYQKNSRLCGFATGKDASGTYIPIKDILAAFIRHLEFSGILADDINIQQSVFNAGNIIGNDNSAETIPELLRHENKNGAKQDKSLKACWQLTPAVTGLIPDSGIVENSGTKDGFILCGDAAGLCNPITGAGIYNAVYSASLASEIIAKALSLNDLSILQEINEIYSSRFGNSINRALRKKLIQKNNWPCSAPDINSRPKSAPNINSRPANMPNSQNNRTESMPNVQSNLCEYTTNAQNNNYFGHKDSKDNTEFLDLVRQTWISFKDYWH